MYMHICIYINIYIYAYIYIYIYIDIYEDVNFNENILTDLVEKSNKIFSCLCSRKLIYE